MMNARQFAIRLIAALVFAISSAAAHAQPATVVIAHGFSPGSKGAWVQSMVAAIIARAGHGSCYRYTGDTGVWTYVPEAGGDGTSDVIVLIFNWVPESDGPAVGPNWNFAQGAADVMYAMMRAPQFAGAPDPGNLPADLVTGRKVQFIGHSRGACLDSEAARRFAAAGIPIDQVTTLDPHPVNGTLDSPFNYDWGDPVPQRWTNVVWADNYWRADGGGIINGLDFDGIPLAATFNTQLSEAALNCCAYSISHSDVHLWYHGTIDLSPAPCDGDQCLNAQMRNTWWPEGYTQRGFYYSYLGGGSAERASLPPGSAPGDVPVLYNGTLDQGTYAGWIHHGGSVSGQVIQESGNWYLRLGPGASSSATHNRFFLPPDSAAITFDLRVTTPGSGESLQLTLIDASNSPHIVGTVAVNASSGWTPQSLTIPSEIPRGALYLVQLQIVGPAPIDAVIGLDNIAITIQPPLIGDINHDGCVNSGDLLAVISAWGPCADPNDCPADIAPSGGDDLVNAADLLAVINNWTPCP